jgi:ADP-heptose:LPS heptosyltransferase
MHTQVINLTRFGDLLQTQPVLSGLKARGGRVSLVCLDSFKGAAALLRDLDGVRVLPGARLLAHLDRSWPLAVAELTAWLDTPGSPGRILNLTPTLTGRLLGRAIQGGDVLGFGMDAHGFGQYSSPWAAFLQAASAYRGCSPFNLVDLFQRVAGLDPGEFRLRAPDAEALDRAGTLLAAAPGQRHVAFQLGASQDYRRWPVSAFVRAGRVILERTGRSPVLLGTAAEGHLAREFAEMADYPSTDLTGRTDLPTLAAVLSRMDLLLTNDTGTMHLAAGLGVPVAAVFLATAQPFDTGPYLPRTRPAVPPLLLRRPLPPWAGLPRGRGRRGRRRTAGRGAGRGGVGRDARFSGQGLAGAARRPGVHGPFFPFGPRGSGPQSLDPDSARGLSSIS